jgi:tripartite-type tricarboxylate transporter receptor subunit TctC
MKSIVVLIAAIVMAMPAWAKLEVPKELQGRTIAVVVPYAAGGQSDVWNRILAARIKESTGLDMVIVNKPGAEALIGTAFVAKAPPDGTTLMGAESSPLVLAPLLKDPNAISRDRFVTVSVGYLSAQGFYVRADSKYRTLKDLMDDVRANPGRVNIGHSHIMSNLVTQRTMGEINGQYNDIPYKGIAPAVTDLLGGHVDVIVGAPIVLQQVRAGKARALAFSSPRRLEEFPQVGLIRDRVPGFAVENFGGVWAPAGTPRHIVDFFNQAYRQAARDPAAQEFLRNTAAGLFDGTPDEAERFVQTKETFWRPIIAKYVK